MTERIEGKVAQVLTRSELVLNIGSEDGVTKGMRFAVLNAKGLSIIDPDSGKVLGSVDLPKVFVQAVRVQSRLSVVRTYKKHRRNVGGTSGLLAGLELFRPPEWVEEVESLRTSDKPYAEELDEEESYVKIGDPVVQIVEGEYE